MAMFAEWRQICRRVFSWQQTGVFLILSIGLILATVMFAIGKGYSSYSLPYKDTERLVLIGRQPPITMNQGGRFPRLSMDVMTFHEWRERSDLFSGIAAFTGGGTWRLKTSSGNTSIRGYNVTPNFFDVLGIWFPEIESWKHTVGMQNLPTVLFTHGVGTGKFGHEAIGQLYYTQGSGGIIVGGILPAGFAFPNEDWMGNTMECGVVPVRAEDITKDTTLLTVIARLPPGITPQIAEQALMSRQDERVTKSFGRIVVMPLQDIMTESSRPIVWGSWALSGLVLILCSANLSGILLVRCSYRLREYSIRTALGAVFLDLARLIMMELAALSILAAGAAWFAARAVVATVGGWVPVKYLSFGRPVFGWEETVFLIGGTVAAVILSALATLIVIGRNYLRGFSLGQLAVFHSQRWTRMILTAGQVAIAMLLLSISYMAVRSLIDIFTRDAGVDTSTRIVTVNHSPALTGSPQANKSVMESTLYALRGGDPAGPVEVYQGSLFSNFIMLLQFHPASPVHSVMDFKEILGINFSYVTPGFFRTANVRMLAGRDFNDQDRSNGVIINAAFARRMGWSPAEAVGQMLNPGMDVIGVVDDFATASWNEPISMTLFMPLEFYFNSFQMSGAMFNYIIRPSAISVRTGNVLQAIFGADPDAEITRNVSWSDLLGESVRGQRFAAISVILFTIAAIAIVVIGISNTVIFIISRRTKDIAIHVAVGAQARHVCWFVIRDMVKAGIIGILIGGLASWWVSRIAAHLIYNGDRYQNMTGLALTSAAMVLIIALASLLPALRALRIEPNRALHSE